MDREGVPKGQCYLLWNESAWCRNQRKGCVCEEAFERQDEEDSMTYFKAMVSIGGLGERMP